MATSVKTAISLQESLFEQVESLARQMKVSRSRVFTLALEDYIHRAENRRLVEKIDSAYQDAPSAAEQKPLHKMRRRHRKMVEGAW